MRIQDKQISLSFSCVYFPFIILLRIFLIEVLENPSKTEISWKPAGITDGGLSRTSQRIVLAHAARILRKAVQLLLIGQGGFQPFLPFILVLRGFRDEVFKNFPKHGDFRNSTWLVKQIIPHPE